MANLWADKHQKASKKDRDSNYEECIQVQSLDAEKKGTIMQTGIDIRDCVNINRQESFFNKRIF